MSFLRGLLDRLLVIAAVVAGGLVPGFIAQYRQRLGGRLDQARLDLELWQHIADRFHQGDIDRLVQYHLKSTDPTFRAEGDAIHSLVVTVQGLQRDVDALQGSLFHQIKYLITHTDIGLARATFSDWVPTFALSLEGIVFALLFAAAIWLSFQALWGLLVWGGERMFSRPRRHVQTNRLGHNANRLKDPG